MNKKKLFGIFSESSRKQFEQQMIEETGIDFSQYRTEELGAKISDIFGVFSWVSLLFKVISYVTPFVFIYYIFAIAKPLWPIESAGEFGFLILGGLWCLISLITVTISALMWVAARRVAGTSSDLIGLVLDLLGKTAGTVRECKMENLCDLS